MNPVCRNYLGLPKCKKTEESKFAKDKGSPPALIKDSYVSFGLVTHVMYTKYVLGLSLTEKCPLIKALTYLQSYRTYMMNYFLDGSCSLSNIPTQRNIKSELKDVRGRTSRTCSMESSNPEDL